MGKEKDHGKVVSFAKVTLTDKGNMSINLEGLTPFTAAGLLLAAANLITSKKPSETSRIALPNLDGVQGARK